MRISYEWIKEFIEIDLSYEELIATLTMIGLEAEVGEKMECEFEGVVVAKITEIEKKAKGNILTLDINKPEHLRVFCTAQNVESGMLAPYAPPGATVKGLTIEKKIFDGFESNGIVCSSSELGIGRDSQGILPLGKPLKPGEDLKSYLFGDSPIEIEVVSNRGDLYSFQGIARELSVHLGRPVRKLATWKPSEIVETDKEIKIELKDPDRCPLYTYRMFNDFIVIDSPPHMLRKLISLGLKPINNIVDITNIVLYETGQPLHPFDSDLLKGNKIIVRCAKNKEKFTTLDGTERNLDPADLLIADSSGGIALGGVMGGLLSEIGWNTQHVLLESAYFDKVGIRRTSRRHALRTDSSTRFERGVDPDKVIMASDRVAWYVNELETAHISKRLVYAGQLEYPKRNISIRVPRIEHCLGYEVPRDEIERILHGLGFQIQESTKDMLELEVPNYRADVEIEEDIAEEVARHHGYNAIPGNLPYIEMGKDLLHDYDRLKTTMRNLLAGWGLYEVVSFALGSKESLGRTHFLRPDDAERIDIVNPLTLEHASLRSNLEETMLNVLASNHKKQSGLRNIYELGRAYWKENGKYCEKDELCIILSNEGIGKSAGSFKQDIFFQMKGLVLEILNYLKIRNPHLVIHEETDQLRELKGDAFIKVNCDGKNLGYIRIIPDEEMDNRDVAITAVAATLDWETLLEFHENYRDSIHLLPIPKYPGSKRDIALLVPDGVLYEDIEKAILQSGGKILTELKLFDIYKGKQIAKGYSSVALNLTFQDLERTLTDEIVDSQIESILNTLKDRLNVTLRDT